MTRPELTGEARDYRLGMWLMLLLALLCLGMAIAGLMNWLPRRLGSLANPAFLLSLGFGAWLGLRAHRSADADQEIRSRRDMIVLLAAQLGKQDDETLAGVVARGGPAGEAAEMILRGRKERAAGAARRDRP